jgi:hypothetical protein
MAISHAGKPDGCPVFFGLHIRCKQQDSSRLRLARREKKGGLDITRKQQSSIFHPVSKMGIYNFEHFNNL